MSKLYNIRRKARQKLQKPLEISDYAKELEQQIIHPSKEQRMSKVATKRPTVFKFPSHGVPEEALGERIRWAKAQIRKVCDKANMGEYALDIQEKVSGHLLAKDNDFFSVVDVTQAMSIINKNDAANKVHDFPLDGTFAIPVE